MAGMTEMVGEVRERQELVVGAAAEIRALLKDIHRVHEEFYKAGNVNPFVAGQATTHPLVPSRPAEPMLHRCIFRPR